MEDMSHSKKCLEYVERELAKIEAKLTSDEIRLYGPYLECREKLTKEIERMEGK